MRRVCSICATVVLLLACCVLTACTPNANEDITLPALAHTTPVMTTPEETTPTQTTPEETTVEESTPEETTPKETTPAVTEPDFENNPDPDGTKRY